MMEICITYESLAGPVLFKYFLIDIVKIIDEFLLKPSFSKLTEHMPFTYTLLQVGGNIAAYGSNQHK